MRISKGVSKKLIALVLMVVMVVTLMPTPALAAEKDSIPTKARMRGNDWDDDAIQIELADTTQTIANVKSNSKNAIAKITRTSVTIREGETSEYKNEITIGVYTKKNGTYTISFDILDKDGKAVSSNKVKVYAYDSPLKSISVEGKDKNSSLLSKKSGKVKVALESGNKIKKLEYGVYTAVKSDSDSSNKYEIKYKTFKNGEKITYGSNPYMYDYEYKSDYSNYYSSDMSTSLVAPTIIRITYIDKYTKQEETIMSYSYRLIK